jgi:hypothetical protein
MSKEAPGISFYPQVLMCEKQPTNAAFTRQKWLFNKKTPEALLWCEYSYFGNLFRIDIVIQCGITSHANAFVMTKVYALSRCRALAYSLALFKNL